MDLAFRMDWTPLFFEFIDSIGMIPAPSCLLACLDNVRRYNLNESRPEILFRKNYCQRTDSDLVARELRVTNIR